MYGAVTMNNTMCLGLFLLVVHAKGLQWTYTSEVLVTVGACPLAFAQFNPVLSTCITILKSPKPTRHHFMI